MPNKDSASNLINIFTKTMDRVSTATSNKEVNTIVKELLLEFTNSEFATFLLYNREKELLYTEDEERFEISMIHPQGLLGNAYLAKKSAIYNHIASEKYYIAKIDNPQNSRIKSQIIVPIIKDENLIGIVRVSRSIRLIKNYTEHDLDLINSLAPFLIKVALIYSSQTTLAEVSLQSTQINKEITKIEKKSHTTQSQEELMLFISNTVHDIRTPANTLYGFLELIESQAKDERLRGYIENAKESALFINQLTNSILDKAKQEYETQKPTLANVNSIKFLSQITNSFSANMLNKNIEYTIFIDPLIPKKIEINSLILKRVLINLIGNAYKFTPKDKSIAFSVKFNQEKSSLEFSIQDSGIGIDKSRQEAIFEAFKQAEESTSEKFGGTGLGLSISAQYVKELGGVLSLESEIDKGSNFYFEIPIKIIDSTPSQKSIVSKKKTITLLTNSQKNSELDIITRYITALGIPLENIIISNTLCIDTTHLFCFESMFNEEIKNIVLEKKIELVVIEESLFALKSNTLFDDIPIISKNTYYGDTIYSTLLTEKISRVLIVDDNKINIELIKAILEDEYCQLSTAMTGEEAILAFKNAYLKGEAYDIIFLDKHLHQLSGLEVIQAIRYMEKRKKLHQIYAISITGDPQQTAQERELFDRLVTKPFKNSELKESFRKALEFKVTDNI